MNRARVRIAASMAALAPLLTCGCGSPALRRAPAAERVEEPHAVGLPDGRRVRVWGAVAAAGEADIACQVGDGPVVLVNPRPGSAVAGRQVGPRVAATPRGEIVVSWIDRGRDAAGDVLVAHSTDRGRTFSPPVLVNDDGAGAGQEYQDMALLPGGSIALVWLDERDAPAGETNRKQVYFALSADGGRTFGRNLPLTASPGGVCPCCRPGLAASAAGALHAIYRDRAGDGLVLRVTTRPAGAARFLPPVTVSCRGWSYAACPVDGPAVLAAPGDMVHVAWMDGSGGRESLWRAVSRDAGRTFQPAIPLHVHEAPPAALATSGPAPAGGGCCGAGEPAVSERQGRPSLAWHAGLGVIAAWEEGGVVWAAAIDRAAERPTRVAEGVSPCVAAGDSNVYVLWSEPDLSRTGSDGVASLRSRLGERRLELTAGAAP